MTAHRTSEPLSPPAATSAESTSVERQDGAQERDAALARIRAALPHFGDDELRVLDVIVARLGMGQGAYGQLRLERDPRDFRQEALEEAADGLVYAACALVRRRVAG